MSKIDRAYFRLRAASAHYRSRERRMLNWLARRIDDDCYVSWSAGKDSMVVAHAALSLRPQTPVLMVDPGAPIHWTDDDRYRMLGYTRAWRLQLFDWDKFADQSIAHEAQEAKYRRAVHDRMFNGLTAYAQENGLTRRITGMRAEESRNRRIMLAATRGETKNTLQPLWDWSTEDVWTYTVKHELPWLSIYDHLGPSARNGLIGKNGREHGRLVYLKRFYPEAFRLACEVFDARDYV